ncbi:MAG: TerD family protein [Candidatus Obscuribacterales bacterium]|nr:TerD family protein [Candidatus Obscuribacterales bacterium]
MGVSLQKGGNLSLTKAAGPAGLEEIIIGLGWNVRATDGAAFDLDANAFLLKGDGKVRGDQDFVFYNQPKSEAEAVVYGGDNRTGAGDGDDETVAINLTKVPADVEKVAVAVTIHDAAARKQSFGQVQSAYVRVVNKKDGSELARFDLSEDASTNTAVVFGEVYRNNGEWKFRAVGQGYDGGLEKLAQGYGVSLN